MSNAASESPRRGLGRGFEVLMGGASVELAHVPVEQIHANPRQPRRRFDHETTAGLAESIRREARRHFGNLVFATVVPRSVRVAEAPSHGLPITHYDRRSRGADAYWKVAMELVERS